MISDDTIVDSWKFFRGGVRNLEIHQRKVWFMMMIYFFFFKIWMLNVEVSSFNWFSYEPIYYLSYIETDCKIVWSSPRIVWVFYYKLFIPYSTKRVQSEREIRRMNEWINESCLVDKEIVARSTTLMMKLSYFIAAIIKTLHNKFKMSEFFEINSANDLGSNWKWIGVCTRTAFLKLVLAANSELLSEHLSQLQVPVKDNQDPSPITWTMLNHKLIECSVFKHHPLVNYFRISNCQTNFAERIIGARISIAVTVHGTRSVHCTTHFFGMDEAHTLKERTKACNKKLEVDSACNWEWNKWQFSCFKASNRRILKVKYTEHNRTVWNTTNPLQWKTFLLKTSHQQ